MSPAPRSPRKIFIALFLFLAVLAWSLMQTNEYFVNGKGWDSDWLNPKIWLTPLSNHEALGQVGVNVRSLIDVNFVDSQHGWALDENGTILATDNGGQSWRRQHSGVKTRLRSVQFTDPQHGWAVGEKGIILATDNGGQSWRQQHNDEKTWLFAVQFTDSQYGWAVGDDGIILATDNGGQRWRQQQSGVKTGLDSVYFTDPQHGWAVGGGDFWNDPGVILVTDNGGQSWWQQQSGVDRRVEAVHFIDSQHGWAVGDSGVILATDNGGQSWRQQQSGVKTGLRAVHFTDSQHGWTVGGEMMDSGGVILATDNGGRSWHQQQNGVTTMLNAVQFTDSQQGWVVGGMSLDSDGIILATDNGGRSWRQQQIGVKTWLRAIHFTDPQHGWVAGSGGIILTTDNGGKSWRRQQSGVKTWLDAIVFIDPQRGWAVGDEGIILATDSGGKSWLRQQSGVKTWLIAIHFTDPQHGWAVGDEGIILATDNAGKNWHQQQSGAKTKFDVVHFTDPQHGWVVGGDGIILATDNGGKSWRQQQSGGSTKLRGVQFADPQHGWAVGGELSHEIELWSSSYKVSGNNGAILATDNGGRSWHQQQSGVETKLRAVQFIDPQHGWAVGLNGAILTTDNGGQSWHRQHSGVETRLEAVKFIDPLHGWALGDAGVILATDNGGITWQNRSLSLLKAIGEVHPKLAVFPSPLALLLLLLTGFSLLLRTYRYYVEPRSLQGGISDAPVSHINEDLLGRKELVKTLADLIRNRDTVPPLAIAITAPWGSGKSSVLGLLQHELQGEVFAVQLNAWHYRDDGQLLAALMEHVREQALPPMLSLDNLVFRSRLLWLRCFAGSGFRGLTALFTGLTATVFFAKQQQWQVLGDWLERELNRELKALIPAWTQPSAAEPWFKLVFALLAALLVYRQLKSWLAAFSAFSPELVALASRLGKSAKEAMQVADWSKDAGLRFRFARDFETVAKALGKGRLLLLIDDLDRCEPKQIESVMTTLNFLFSTPAPCYAVLAMDWDNVIGPLGLAFKDLAVARDDTDTKGRAFAEHYLEKIIQIRIHLPAVDGSQVALIDHSRRTDEEVVDWWGKLAGCWPWLNAMDRAFYPFAPTLALRERWPDSVDDLRWARFAAAVLQSPLRLLVSVLWRGLEAGLWMCWQAVKRFNSKMLTPVSDGLLILLLATALAFVAVQLGVGAQDFASRQSKPDVGKNKAPVGEPAKNVMPEPEKKPIEASELKAAAAPVVFVDEQHYPTHYGLWAAAGCLSLMLLLMVWRLSLRVQDTQAFIEVMRQWQLWLAAHHDTPRDWKRLLNRARLFAMRVRVYRQKPWYAAFDEKWQAWRFRRQPLPIPFQHDELDERLAMHLLMLDVYTQGELAESVLQFFRHNKNTDSFNRLNDALMKRPPNAFPELKTLMNDLSYRYYGITNEQAAPLKRAEAQLHLWLNLYAGLNTLRS